MNPLDDTRKEKEVVTCTGFEPAIFCLKDRGLGHLVEHVEAGKHGAASRNRTCIPELEAPRPDPLDDSCVVEAVRVELTSLRLKGEYSTVELRFRIWCVRPDSNRGWDCSL